MTKTMVAKIDAQGVNVIINNLVTRLSLARHMCDIATSETLKRVMTVIEGHAAIVELCHERGTMNESEYGEAKPILTSLAQEVQGMIGAMEECSATIFNPEDIAAMIETYTDRPTPTEEAAALSKLRSAGAGTTTVH